MKLRLPISLLSAVLVTASVYAENINVGVHTGKNNLPSASGNRYVIDGDKTLADGDRMGVLNEQGEFVTLGKEQWDASWGKWTQASSGTVSKNVEVTGTLTINGTAQVQLGGQYKTATDSLGLTSVDEYTGIIADKVVVNGAVNEDGAAATTNLNSWNASVNTLEVNSGKVVLHNKVQSGNNHFVYEDKDSKQVRIKHALNINGGETIINLNQLDANNGADDTHVFTSFGSINFVNPSYSWGALTDADSAEVVKSLITQTAGTLTVNGKTASVGGLNILQSGGTMNISTDGEKYHSWHILSDYGDSVITQTNEADASTVLTIGGIKAYNSKYDTVLDVLLDKGVTIDPSTGELEHEGKKVEINPSVTINQSGEGTISIIQGIDLANQKSGAASTERSYINQSGGGSINLGGAYKGATYDINQTAAGGTINLTGSMTAGSVNQESAEGVLNIAAGASMSADKMTVAGKVENKGTLDVADLDVTGGILINHGVYNGEQAVVLALDDTEGLMNITITGGQVVNYGTLNGSISVEGGILELLDGNVGAITMTAGDIIVKGDSMADNLTLNGGSITFEKGAVLTVSNGVALNGAQVFVNVDSLEDIENGAEITLFDNATGTLDFEDTVITFVDAAGEKTQAVVSGAATGGSVTVNAVIPEPTTATLSLLALAALAARRRRR